jgi:hypothetical protein
MPSSNRTPGTKAEHDHDGEINRQEWNSAGLLLGTNREIQGFWGAGIQGCFALVVSIHHIFLFEPRMDTNAHEWEWTPLDILMVAQFVSR